MATNVFRRFVVVVERDATDAADETKGVPATVVLGYEHGGYDQRYRVDANLAGFIGGPNDACLHAVYVLPSLNIHTGGQIKDNVLYAVFYGASTKAHTWGPDSPIMNLDEMWAGLFAAGALNMS